MIRVTSILVFTLMVGSMIPFSNAQENKSDLRYNLKLKTWGGQQFWTDLLIVGGWKIQRNELDDHCRLIDSKYYRIAWGSYDQCRAELDRQLVAGEVIPYEGEVVILLHGLMRTHRSLNKMANYLRESGELNVIQFEYASSRKEVASHARALNQVIEGLGPKVTKVHFVGHSLGNIVVRKLLDDLDEDPDRQYNAQFGRMVMLGPPNQGSRMARVLKNSFLFTTIAGVGGVQLSTTWEALEPQLETPSFEFGIIAGAQNQDQRWSNFVLTGPDDFTVSLSETKLVGADDFLVRPLVHSTMMRQPDVIEATLRFLKNGYFVSRALRKPITSLKDE